MAMAKQKTDATPLNPDGDSPDLGESRNAEIVAGGFWPKMRKFAGKLPFAEDLAASWYAVRDPKTPTRVKAALLAALAYFVMPVDAIPDVVAVLGFTDDAAVLAATLAMLRRHITPDHIRRAKISLQKQDDTPSNSDIDRPAS